MSQFSSGGLYHKSEDTRLLSAIAQQLSTLVDVNTDSSNSSLNTSVPISATSVEISSPDNNRKGITVFNNPSSAETLFISYVTPATEVNAIAALGDHESFSTTYRGTIYGIWSAASGGNASVTTIY